MPAHDTPISMLVNSAMCAGPILVYPVHDGTALDARAPAMCGSCGAVLVIGTTVDDRHADTPVLTVDE